MFSDERLKPVELAEQLSLTISDTGFIRLLYFVKWLNYNITGQDYPTMELAKGVLECQKCGN
jgi:hypothetical protein